ncbi:MAG TPA: hypothetical protein PKK07_00730 [bacterium]|nr:hypothetical protein [bacterium]HOA18481.1 hypothetical protein [bacterium]
MLKILYLLIIFSWSTFLYVVFQVWPGNYSSIFLFIFTLFLALGFTISLFVYKFLRKKNPGFTNYQYQLKNAMKYGFYISFGISGLALLRAFKIMSLLNIGLFMLLYLGIYYQLRNKR